MVNKLLKRILGMIVTLGLIVLSFSNSSIRRDSSSDTIRQFTRLYEFDYASWEMSAFWNQALSNSLGSTHHLTYSQQRKIIEDYFALLRTSTEVEQKIADVYGDAAVDNPEEKALKLEGQLKKIESILTSQKRMAESVLQYQIGQTIQSLGLANLGTPFPPILFQSTKLPNQLVLSPRDAIIQEESVSLIADMDLTDSINLEKAIEANTDLSALVVSVGGVGTYPTMVVNTTNMSLLIETVAHEWTHNYLTLRPLGLRYSSSGELRTMNETAASIAGEEISQAVIELFYSDLIEIDPIMPKILNASAPSAPAFQDESFNFSNEMYQTRVRVDELLAQGKVEEAERFMESQRLTFWENGYHIRRLNQAYFAFHGAYADKPFSAAGKDPVGDDVRLFRSRQASLSSFIRKMSWMSTYTQLRTAAKAF